MSDSEDRERPNEAADDASMILREASLALAMRSPQDRIRFWCGLIARWRSSQSERVPEPLLVGLSEAEYIAALNEIGRTGHQGPASEQGMDAALARVRRQATSGDMEPST